MHVCKMVVLRVVRITDPTTLRSMKRKIIAVLDQSQTDVLNLAVDVSKNSLSYYAELEGDDLMECWESTLRNRSEDIIKELGELKAEASKRGYEGLRIICESTGVYHRRLLRTARQQGCLTCLISGEATYKGQVIQSNDYNKTDKKDPRTILLVYRFGKRLVDRRLSGGWLVLRQLNLNYERMERESTQIKNRLHAALYDLFCDLSFKNQWIFNSQTAKDLARFYGFNPYRIVEEGRSGLRRRLKRRHLREITIKRIWEDACQSAHMQQDPQVVSWMEEEVRDLYKHLSYLQQHRLDLRYRMVEELEKLHAKGELKTDPHNSPIGPFMLARVLAEIGPLGDFKTIQQLWRYAGLNLRQKQSGGMQGPNRLSKKGRSRLRRCSMQACIKLVVRGELFGEYYHGKKAMGMAGNKALTAVSRRLLKLLHGIEKSGGQYQPQRVFDQSSLKQAA